MLFAQRPHDEVWSILAFFGSFWLAVTIIATSAIVLWHWRRTQRQEIAAQLVQQMLQQNRSADEIERVLAAMGSNASSIKPGLLKQKPKPV